MNKKCLGDDHEQYNNWKNVDGWTHSDRSTVQTSIVGDTFQVDGFSAHEMELLVQVHDIMLKTLEVMSFFVVRGDGITRST